MKNFLFKKYPVIRNIKTNFIISGVISFWVYFFLLGTEPFDINTMTIQEKKLLPFYGVLLFLCYNLGLLYQHAHLKKHNNWLIINEIATLSIVLIVFAPISYLFYSKAIMYNHKCIYNFFKFTYLFYLPAIFTILPIIIFLRYLIPKLTAKKNNSKKITITGKGSNEILSIPIKDLLFIQASDNYIEIYYIDNDLIKRKTIRNSISTIEKQLPLIKTHRSFLINPLHFKQFKVENKKTFVDIGFGHYVPISRGLKNSVKQSILLTTNN